MAYKTGDEARIAAHEKYALLPIHRQAVLMSPRLYKDGTLSDFIITCKGRLFKVHKLVLSQHSDVLYQAATNDNFKVRVAPSRAE